MEEMGEIEDEEFGDLQEDFLVLATEGATEAAAREDADAAAEEDAWRREQFGDDFASDEDYDYETHAPGEAGAARLASHRAEANRRELELTEGRQMMEECFDQLVDE